jgi:hypothetical protein
MRTLPLLRCPFVFRPRSLRVWKSVFGAYPTWDLLFAAVERVISDKQFEKTFTADLEHLSVGNEDSFQWPLEDPHYCLLLGNVRDYYRRFKAKVSENEDQDEGMKTKKTRRQEQLSGTFPQNA